METMDVSSYIELNHLVSAKNNRRRIITVCNAIFRLKTSCSSTEMFTIKLQSWAKILMSLVHQILGDRSPNLSIFERDSIYAIARICYRPSVRHTGGSVKNAWS